ncbi:MAG: type II toxin-antitoxin system RelE/ParE family toxin [Bacteroidales bacterium]|jgi:hypothetical protein|nr:type II toxin-antitoxin system RelE/ParE family toxin [Bacteroidales bacterium]
MIDVTILDESEEELWEAVAYYENKAQGLGLNLNVEIQRSIQVIAEYPERWYLRVDGTRRCLVHRFPYLIVYIYQNNHIWILAIAHCKRRSAYWSKRTRRIE